MQEDTRIETAHANMALMLDAVKPWETFGLEEKTSRRNIASRTGFAPDSWPAPTPLGNRL